MNVFSWPSGSLSATAVVTVALLRASASSIAVDGGEDESPAEPFRWDSNKVARAKVILAFEEHERQAPRYRTAITNWNPGFVECDGITNFVFLGESGGAEGWTRRYRGGNRDRWVDVALNVFKSSREAHEYMVKLQSDLPRGQPGDNEVTDPKQRIGFRCFRGAFRDVMEQILFIRNNYCVAIFGKSVKVETLARDLDRQLVELSEEMPKGSP